MYIWVALKERVTILWQTTKICSNQGFLLEPKKKLPETKAMVKFDAETISSWSYDMECHAKKRVERHCELANKATPQRHEVATPCMDDCHLKEEENEQFALKLFCNVCIWLVSGDLIFCGL